MDRDSFWKIINASRKDAEAPEDVAAAVTERLQQLPPVEIVAFQRIRQELMAESYRWDLWAVAYIVNGGCSDDGFDYFRGWLMTQGRKRWESAMSDPQVVGKWAADDQAECEDMLYVADDAFKAVTGAEILADPSRPPAPKDPVGQRWKEEDLERLYPKLWAKFS